MACRLFGAKPLSEPILSKYIDYQYADKKAMRQSYCYHGNNSYTGKTTSLYQNWPPVHVLLKKASGNLYEYVVPHTFIFKHIPSAKHEQSNYTVIIHGISYRWLHATIANALNFDFFCIKPSIWLPMYSIGCCTSFLIPSKSFTANKYGLNYKHWYHHHTQSSLIAQNL